MLTEKSYIKYLTTGLYYDPRLQPSNSIDDMASYTYKRISRYLALLKLLHNYGYEAPIESC